VCISERPPTSVTVVKLAWCCVLAGVVAAVLMFPFVGGIGLISNRASDVVANGSAQLLEGDVPQVSTMVDAAGNPIAWLYSQRRFEVPTHQIADTMKLAIVSIEDKRFAEHNGVDWPGTLTGLSGYLTGNLDTRGGSTIEQQYVKNYQLLVTAQTDAERRAAVETTPARKLREIRMALTLDKTFSKAEILTRYLNLVFFGNGAFGVQDAAQTYFGIDAAQLNWQQAALLAGMVQSTSSLNPYTNPDGALQRRNVVLDTMIENLPQHADELRAAKAEPLGVLRRLLIAAGRQRNIDVWVDRLHDLFAAEQLRQPPRIEAAFGEQARALIMQLDAACRAVEHLAQATEAAFTEHPDAEILTSFPGVGILTGARMLAEIGDDRSRFSDARVFVPTPDQPRSPERPGKASSSCSAE